ncbi:FAD-dependent oxidoreductase [Arthrobacter sp. ov118]|uniref:FAD-dependent oxidoreductase n=1 Tax=Arthrobacter sp. ov118 TaxID=1761747 RepID=UPI0008E11F03|nr:FAD-dependent oxidoreductase [Arthrobacter sp. ov118]SFU15416.1 assimilatory nitrate reductase (NADH) beta subunit [Arthrobacter sp. ov118]
MSEQVVIVGFGPVAARLIDELLPAVRSGLAHLTVIGEESDAAYNRVLVADLGVGRTTAGALALSDAAALVADGVDVRLGVRVRRVDRARQRVVLTDGTTPHYDRLVFATGSRPVIPNLTGLNPDPAHPVLPAGVTALRDLHDAAVLREAVAGGKRVVVLGGGVLGLETALAAAEEGARVTVVHNGRHPLGRNIDRSGGGVLAASLRNCGVRVAGNARSTGVEHNAPDGGFSALLLEDGSAIDGDLLVLSCGVRPRTELAEGCGLSTATGILVDHKLRAHHEPHIFAIGDCAEVRCPDPACGECRTARGPSGLVGPGWRQAEWLAEYLTLLAEGTAICPGDSNDSAPGGGAVGAAASLPELPMEKPGVIVLKARGTNLAVAGDVSADPWDEEVLSAGAVNGRARLQVAQWADPEHGRYVKMTTRAGVLEGLVAVGMPRTAAELVQLFERGAELPADRSLLLRLDGPDQPASHGAADASRTVCRCAGVSGTAVAAAVTEGCATVPEVSAATRAGTGCGGCHEDIKGIIEAHFQGAVA